MHRSIVVSLRAPATIVERGDVVYMQSPKGNVCFRSLSASMRVALLRLSEGAAEGDLAATVTADGTHNDALERWYYYLAAIEGRGELTYDVRHRGRVLARMIIMSAYFRPGRGAVERHDRWVISRFAYLRRHDEKFFLESPLSCARIELHQPIGIEMVAALAKPSTSADLAAAVAGSDFQTAHAFLALLEYAGMLSQVGDACGAGVGDEAPSLRTWNFADLLFHARSRAGRHDEPFRTFGFLGELASLPAVRPPVSERTFDLYVPDIAHVARRDPPFTRVLEDRMSVRSYGARPVTVEQLGEFLYRAARVRHLIEADGDRILYQSSSRPYPGAGACYELEIYIAANLCAGLPVGLYHYDPLHHRLEIIPGGDSYVPVFLRDVFTPVEDYGSRQVLIILAARFQRLAWKYNASSYAAILKNVGVLYQTMYLVATAMGLAPCALGGGNSEVFARAVGVAFHEETSVGEFMLGSRAHDAGSRRA